MGTFEVASKFLSIILILGEIAQVSVTTISSLPIHSSEETSISDSTILLSTEWSSSMTYTSITDWSAPAWSDSLSTFTIDINNIKKSDNPPMQTRTESTSVGLDTEGSKLTTATSEEILTFDSTVILSTQLSSSMTYTLNIHSSDAAFSSNSKVNLQTNETSGYPQTETETLSTLLKEGLSNISSVNSSTSMISETISAFITSTNTESKYLGLNSDTSKLQTVSSEDTYTFDSTAILSTQLFSSMTWTLTTNWNVSARSDALSIYTDSITSTETSENSAIKTDMESTYVGSDTESSKMKTMSLEERSTLDSTVRLSIQLSSSMTYTPITDWSSYVRSGSLSINTVSITSNETNGNAPIETGTTSTALNETLSTIFAITPSTSTMLETIVAFSPSKYTESLYLSSDTEASKMQTVSSDETSTLDSTILLSTEWSSSMTYTSITDWSAPAWSHSLSTFTIDINNTKTSDNPPMQTHAESTYVRLDTEASKLTTVTSEEISTFDSTVILSTQLSSSMTYTLNIHSSDAAFSSNSKVNLQTNETSGYLQTETETLSTLLKEGLSNISSVNSSTSMISETISAFITSTNTESNYLGLNSDTSKLQTVSSEDTYTFDSTAILSTQLFSSMTWTLTTNWNVSARSDALSIYTDSITSTETSENSAIKTDMESTYVGSDTESSKIKTMSLEERSTLDSTVRLSIQLSSSMTYTPNIHSSDAEFSSNSNVNLQTNETSGYLQTETETLSTLLKEVFSKISSVNSSTSMMSETISAFITSTNTESNYLELNSDTSKLQTVSSEDTYTFDSTAILSTQLFSSMTWTLTTNWNVSARSDALSIYTDSITSTDTSENSAIKTDMESTYVGSDTESSKMKTMSLEERSTLDSTVRLSIPLSSSMTYTPITDWSSYVRSGSLSINTVSITSNETNGNAPIETGTTSTALNETLSTIFAITPSTSTMLETIVAFSPSKYTESLYLNSDTEASKMQTVSSDETSTLDSTILLSTEWSSSMTYTSITDWSAPAWSHSLSTFTIDINNTKTSDNPPMQTHAESTYVRLDTEASKLTTVTSEEISTFDSTVILSTQLSSSMTYTLNIHSSDAAFSSNSNVDLQTNETSGYPQTETETLSTLLKEGLSNISSVNSSTSMISETISAFITSTNTESNYLGLNSDTSKLQTVSSEDTYTFDSTAILSTQLFSSMTWTLTTNWNVSARSDALSIYTDSITSTETSENSAIKTDMESTYVGSDTESSKIKTMSLEERSTLDSTVRLSIQLSSSMTYTPNIHSSDAAFSSNSNVNLQTNETSGYLQTETETLSTLLKEVFSKISSVNSSTSMMSETISAFITSTNTESNYLELNSDTSKLQTVSSEDTYTFDSTAILSTQLFSSMTWTLTTNWNVSARSDALSIYTDSITSTDTSENSAIKTDMESTYVGSDTESSKMKTMSLEERSTLDSTVRLSIQLSSSMTYTPITDWSSYVRSGSLSINTVSITSNETNGNAPIETGTTSTALNETLSTIFAITPSTSTMLETIVAFSPSKYTESLYLSSDTEASKMQTVSSDETSTLDSTILLSTEWSSSMTYTSITDWSAPAWSHSLSTFTIDINNTKTSDNPPMQTHAESTYVRLDTEASKLTTVTSEEISTFDSTVILSTQLSSSMTYTLNIHSSDAAFSSNSKVNLQTNETSGYLQTETETLSTLLKEGLSNISSVNSSTSMISETISAFITSTNTESNYLGLNSDTSKLQTVSSEDTYTFDSTAILSTQLFSSMTWTLTTNWNVSARSDALSIYTDSITSTETSENSAIKTDMESTYVGSDTESSKIKTMSLEERSTLDSTVRLSIQLSSSMTYTPNIHSSDAAFSSNSNVNLQTNETSGYLQTETETLSTLLKEVFSKISSVNSSTSMMSETISAFITSTNTESNYLELNSDTSKLQTVSSEDTYTFDSTAILSTQLFSSMTWTLTTNWNVSARSDALSIYTDSITSTDTSENSAIKTDMESTYVGSDTESSKMKTMSLEERSTLDSIQLSSSMTYTPITDWSSYVRLDTEASKLTTATSEEISTFDSTVILSTQSSPSMTYTPTTDLSSSARSDSLSKDTVSINSNEISGNAPIETETSSITLNETLSTLFSNTPSKSVMLETTFAFSASTDTKSAFNTDTSKMQTVSSEEGTSAFNSTLILSIQLSSSMTYTPINLWNASTKLDVLSILTVNTNGTETSGFPSLETETTSIIWNETFSKIFSLTLSTSMALETTSAFATLGSTESIYIGLDSEPSRLQTVSLEDTSIFKSTVIMSTHSPPNMTYTPTTGLSSFARSDSLSKDTVSINSNEISGNAPIEIETSSITLNETLSTLFSNTPSKSLMLETTFAFSASTDTKSAFNTDTSKMQTVSSEETSTLDSTSILSSQSSSRSGYNTYAFQESTQSLLNIRSTISVEETSHFVHMSATSTLKLSVSMMHTYGSDWNVYTTRENENTPYSPTIPALSSSVSFGVYGISTSSKAPDLGVIIGAVVGCVILLTFAIFCLLICFRKRKRRQTRSEDSEDQVAGDVPEPSTSKMNILPLLQPFPEMAVPKTMAAKATFALHKWGPLPPITPQLDWMKEIGDSWKKKKKRKHKPEDVQTEEGHDTISPNEDQTGETETGNSNETLGTPDDVISKTRKKSKKKKEKGATVDISTGDFTEREPMKNSMQRKEYNLPTDDITDNDEIRKSSKNSVSGEHTEGARESLDKKAETKKKRKKKHRRHGEDRQEEETVHGLNTRSEKKKKKKKRKQETETDDLLQKEFVQDSDMKEERKIRKHIKAEEDLLQPEYVKDADTKKEKRKKKKKKKHRLDVDKELKDECVDDEVKAEQRKHHVDSEYVFQGESINDVDVTTDLKKYPKDRMGIKDELETESSVSLEKKMEISNNTTTKHQNDNEKEHEGEPIDGIDKKPKLERKQKIKQRLDLLDEKTQYESAELGNETQKEGKHDLLQRQNDVERKEENKIVQNAKAMNNDKAKDPTSLGDLATEVRESEVVSSEYVEYFSEKKKKKKKHPSQEVERENTQTINDIIEPDVKRRKRKTRHRAAPLTELNSSDEDFIITRNKSHTEGDRGFTTSKHDFERKEESEIVQNAKAMDNEKAKDSASLGDLATDVRESEVESSKDVAYRSEKKKKKKKKKHPSQEVERENTQTINDIVEPDAKRRKRKKRHRAVPMTELDSSEEDVIRTRNKSHTEGDRGKTSANAKDHIVSFRPDKQSIEDNTPRPITSEINKDIAEIQVKPKIAFVEVEPTQGGFVQDTLKENNEEQNIKTIEGESFA